MSFFERVLSFLFGGGRNVVVETAEVFRENAEAGAARGADVQKAALNQHAAEFSSPHKGGFDRFMDGINRLPRPLLALGTLGLFVSAMVDPLWFGERMQGLALVPEPLWWLLGAIVSFYFGARHQAKGQEFQRSIAQTMARAPAVVANTRALRALSAGAEAGAEAGVGAGVGVETRVGAGSDAGATAMENPALTDWRAARAGSRAGAQDDAELLPNDAVSKQATPRQHGR